MNSKICTFLETELAEFSLWSTFYWTLPLYPWLRVRFGKLHPKINFNLGVVVSGLGISYYACQGWMKNVLKVRVFRDFMFWNPIQASSYVAPSFLTDISAPITDLTLGNLTRCNIWLIWFCTDKTKIREFEDDPFYNPTITSKILIDIAKTGSASFPFYICYLFQLHTWNQGHLKLNFLSYCYKEGMIP